MAVEPPKASPRPPEPLDDEPRTDPGLSRVSQRMRLFTVLVGGGFSLMSLGGVAVAYEKLRDAAADAGSRAAEQRLGDVTETSRMVKVVDADLQQHKAAEAQALLELKNDVHEQRVESRELYKALMEGKRSEKLEKPLPPLPPSPLKDGGR